MEPTNGGGYIKKPGNGLLIHEMAPAREIAQITAMRALNAIKTKVGLLRALLIAFPPFLEIHGPPT
jgi:hypothetical protein